MYYVKSVVLLISCVFSAQGEPGTPEWSPNSHKSYVEFVPGNLPILLVVPEGGTNSPVDLDTHNTDSSVSGIGGSVDYIIRDFERYTGRYPYVVANRIELEHLRVDGSEAYGVGETPEPDVKKAYDDFHSWVSRSMAEIRMEWGGGLMIILYSKSSSMERVEIGYGINGPKLRSDEDEIRTAVVSSFISPLLQHSMDIDPVEIIRGNNSLGYHMSARGINTCPSPVYQSPEYNGPVFDGGEGDYLMTRYMDSMISSIRVTVHSPLTSVTSRQWYGMQNVLFYRHFVGSVVDWVKETHGINVPSKEFVVNMPQFASGVTRGSQIAQTRCQENTSTRIGQPVRNNMTPRLCYELCRKTESCGWFQLNVHPGDHACEIFSSCVLETNVNKYHLFKREMYQELLLSVYEPEQVLELTPGETYFAPSTLKPWVEYTVGNMPVVINAGHGGKSSPIELPETVSNHGGDGGSDISAYRICRYLTIATGLRPHFILNHVRSDRINPNVDQGIVHPNGVGYGAPQEAIDSIYFIWDMIQNGIDNVISGWGVGVMIDYHSNARHWQRTELGIGYTPFVLNSGNQAIRDNISRSNIRKIIEHREDIDPVEIVRGKFSFGYFLSARGVSTMPSNLYPEPENWEYFWNGGYISGNRFSPRSYRNNTIDTIQIENYMKYLKDVGWWGMHSATYPVQFAGALLEYLTYTYQHDLPHRDVPTIPGLSTNKYRHVQRANTKCQGTSYIKRLYDTSFEHCMYECVTNTDCKWFHISFVSNTHGCELFGEDCVVVGVKDRYQLYSIDDIIELQQSTTPPTISPSVGPTTYPTKSPTNTYTVTPTVLPTSVQNTAGPTPTQPTVVPTVLPTSVQTTAGPTPTQPTVVPTVSPTSVQNTAGPTPTQPTVVPTVLPTSVQNTAGPTPTQPTVAPTNLPTPVQNTTGQTHTDPTVAPTPAQKPAIHNDTDVIYRVGVEGKTYSFKPDGERVKKNVLNLYRGVTYTFLLDAIGGYPLWIKTMNVSGSAESYDSGVRPTNGIDHGNITFTVPMNAPNKLYYVCENDVSMSGTMRVFENSSRLSRSPEPVVTKLNTTSSNSTYVTVGFVSLSLSVIVLTVLVFHIVRQNTRSGGNGTKPRIRYTKLSRWPDH